WKRLENLSFHVLVYRAGTIITTGTGVQNSGTPTTLKLSAASWTNRLPSHRPALRHGRRSRTKRFYDVNAQTLQPARVADSERRCGADRWQSATAWNGACGTAACGSVSPHV